MKTLTANIKLILHCQGQEHKFTPNLAEFFSIPGCKTNIFSTFFYFFMWVLKWFNLYVFCIFKVLITEYSKGWAQFESIISIISVLFNCPLSPLCFQPLIYQMNCVWIWKKNHQKIWSSRRDYDQTFEGGGNHPSSYS